MKNKELGFIYILSILTVFCVILNYLNIIPYYKFGIIFFLLAAVSTMYILKLLINGYTLKKLFLASLLIMINIILLIVHFYKDFSNMFELIMSS